MRLRAAEYIWAATLALVPISGQAATLEFPATAVLSVDQSEGQSSYDLPLSAWRDGGIDSVQTEGQIERQVWKIPATEKTTLQLIAPLREQLEQAGYEIAFECEDRTCGGFDFRFSTDVLPEPDMHVDLGNFRFLSALRESGEGPNAVTLMVSRSRSTGFIQLTQVSPASPDDAVTTVSTRASDEPDQQDAGPLAERIEARGFVALDGISFSRGNASLGAGGNAALAELATYLKNNPDRSVTLVGHTDAEGALSTNIDLSKRRAEAVKETLVTEYNVPRPQVRAEGMGYLAPRATNLTEEGRQQNRRVEAILTSYGE